MKTTNKRITYRHSVDPYSNGILGDLTEKQWAELVTVARLSPGYTFGIICYHGGPSSTATHIAIFSDENERNEVGLVGKRVAQYYDNNPLTEKVIKRVAHRVYRLSGLNFEG